VRAFAREKGVDLTGVVGSGPAGRITKEDVVARLSIHRDVAETPASAAKVSANSGPAEDFSKYGPVEEVPLGRIKKIAGAGLAASWMAIPQVTHGEEADITELEAFRQTLNRERQEGEAAFSPLVLVIKAVAVALRDFPLFNASLAPGGESVILKRYRHLGIAVDTPQGLVVPVLRDADAKGLKEIARELARLSGSARAGKLTIPEVMGASFTISSLGGIGGTGFTPLVYAPQVAILGVSKSAMRPVWDGQQFLPRLMLPFALSYDHRVIDGAEAARFCLALRQNLEDLRRLLL
jgi:pyruvate dehydrogenase E2 component (dihydrolipoamide acetyltransferase)